MPESESVVPNRGNNVPDSAASEGIENNPSETNMASINNEVHDLRIPIRLWEQLFDMREHIMMFPAPPPMDVRREDRLVCPLCMTVHLPVERSVRVPIKKDGPTGDGEPRENVDDINNSGGNRGEEDDSGESDDELPSLHSDFLSDHPSLPSLEQSDSRGEPWHSRVNNNNLAAPNRQSVSNLVSAALSDAMNSRNYLSEIEVNIASTLSEEGANQNAQSVQPFHFGHDLEANQHTDSSRSLNADDLNQSQVRFFASSTRSFDGGRIRMNAGLLHWVDELDVLRQNIQQSNSVGDNELENSYSEFGSGGEDRDAAFQDAVSVLSEGTAELTLRQREELYAAQLSVNDEVGVSNQESNTGVQVGDAERDIDSVNLNRLRNNGGSAGLTVAVLGGLEVEIDPDECSEVTIPEALEQSIGDNGNNEVAERPTSPAGVESVVLPPLDHEVDDDSTSTSGPRIYQREVTPTSSDSSDRPIFDDISYPDSVPPLAPRIDVESSSDDSVPTIASRRDEDSSSDSDSTDGSLPPLIHRDFSSDSSGSGSMPPLARRRDVEEEEGNSSNENRPRNPRSFAAGASRVRTLASGSNNSNSGPEWGLRRDVEERYSEIFTSIRQSVGRTTGRVQQRNTLRHLRDYGAIKVFASATCPICLDDCNVVVALKCGHCLCQDDFEKMGGYLASDKEKLAEGNDYEVS